MRKRWLALIVSAVVASTMAATGVSTAVAESGRGVGTQVQPQRQPYTKLLRLSVKDIQEFWTEEFPALFGVDYIRIPNNRIIPYDERTEPGEFGACSSEDATYEDEANNAFYCLVDDTVRYDDGTLFPDLYEQFGPFAIAQVLAHEWGHAIQGRYLTEDEFLNAPSVLQELQADCFAGAWVDYVNDGKSRHLELGKGDLDIGLAGMLNVRDPVGSDPENEQAHGSGFDRVAAFQSGFENGAESCLGIYENPPPITEAVFISAEDALRGGDAAKDEIVDIMRQDLDLYWSQFTELDPYDSVDDVVAYDIDRKRSLPACEAFGLRPARPKAYANSIFYCAEDDYIAFDGDYMSEVYETTGDFGVGILISNVWASAMQTRLDLRSRPVTLGLQADCFSGSYAGSVPTSHTEQTANARGQAVDREFVLILEPGDLDEVVQAFLLFGDPPDAAEAQRGTSFERMQAFRLGFLNGEADCLALTE